MKITIFILINYLVLKNLYYCNNKSQENNINIIKDEKEKTKKATEIENYNTTLKTPAPVNNNNIDEQENKKKKSKKDNKQENKDFLNKKKGRKKIDKIFNEEDREIEEGHNKFSEDNIMRKIKTNIIEFIIINLDESLKNKNMTFLKINKHLSENLKRDYNMNLMNRTIKDIFSNESIRAKYKRKNYDNKILIDKIFNEKYEKETIKILNKTYYDMVVKIREKNLDSFLDKIIKKENNMQKKSNIEEYMNLLKDLLFRFKEWFNEKQGRNREKNNKKENDELSLNN